jgi:predicted kinase
VQQVIFNVGVSGSGKSTWTTNFIKNNSNYLRINRDDIRKTLVGDLLGYYNRKDLNTVENIVSSIENHIGEKALLNEYSVIVDNTNLSIKTINEKIKVIEKYNNHYGTNIQFSFRVFPLSDHWTLKARVNERDKFPNLDYIDKQLKSLPTIIKYLEDNYKEKIVYE